MNKSQKVLIEHLLTLPLQEALELNNIGDIVTRVQMTVRWYEGPV